MAQHKVDTASTDELQRLQAEVTARRLEADWLKTHYERHLRDALAREAANPPSSGEWMTASSGAVEEDVRRLRTELERAMLAERRYLDRIEELKEQLADEQAKGAIR